MDSIFGSHLVSLLPVYAAYLLATASPGPSTMAIMGVAMHSGRRSALLLAAGILTGSISWAVLAATGVSVVLASYAQALFVIKVAGGLYLLYLAWKSAKSAMTPRRVAQGEAGRPASAAALYLRGLMLHLTNPKAVLAWIAIMSLGLNSSTAPSAMIDIIVGCAALGTLTFGGYALVFSAGPMVRLYQKARRGIEATLALYFGYAGLRLLLSRA